MAHPSLMAARETPRPTPFCSNMELDHEELRGLEGGVEGDAEPQEAKPEDSYKEGEKKGGGGNVGE